MQPIHILNQLGILTSFSLATKITEEEIQKYITKHKKNGKSKSEVDDMIKEKILKEIENVLKSNKVPGLISADDIASQIASQYGIDKSLAEQIPDLNRLIMIIAQKMLDKKYNKMALCYCINSLVNLLKLTEHDFEKFHRKNREDEEDEDEFNDSDNPDDMDKF